MVKNTKAMSQIVTTVILVVLVLVAIGIVWGVISNLLSGGADDIDVGVDCLGIMIEAEAVVNTTLTAYDVTVNRIAGGGDIGGIKVTLFNSTGNSGLLDLGLTVGELETKTGNVETTGTGAANKVKIVPYLIDASGNENYCGETEFTF